ncbi:MAG: hypothetical protein ABEJ28_00735 [Salinigranum sp.]
MPHCGNSGADGPLQKESYGTVTVRREVDSCGAADAEVPSVEPTEWQAFAREFRSRSGMD